MELLTERLREFVAEDWPAVLGYQSDPLYLRYNDWTERTPAAVQEFVGWFLAQQAETPRYKFQLVIELRVTGELIGNCGVRLKEPGSWIADMGYEVAPAQWGHGYATEAARALRDFGFGPLGAHRIEAWCVADNLASARVLEKLGMRLEGQQRDKRHYKGRWWDRLLYAVLAGEVEVGGPLSASRRSEGSAD